MGYFYMEPNTTFHEFLYRFLTDLEDEPRLPHVISISYVIPEGAVTPTAAIAFTYTAQALGLQGIPLVAASGDDGAASSLDRNKEKGECWVIKEVGLQVGWPASS